jgi:hypothetical protein
MGQTEIELVFLKNNVNTLLLHMRAPNKCPTRIKLIRLMWQELGLNLS